MHRCKNIVRIKQYSVSFYRQKSNRSNSKNVIVLPVLVNKEFFFSRVRKGKKLRLRQADDIGVHGGQKWKRDRSIAGRAWTAERARSNRPLPVPFHLGRRTFDRSNVSRVHRSRTSDKFWSGVSSACHTRRATFVGRNLVPMKLVEDIFRGLVSD